jgi:NADPH2:quinone reductase
VFDPVGGAMSEAALRATAWNGRFLVIGFASGEIARIPLNLPLLKGASIVGVFWGDFVRREPAANGANVRDLMQALAAGRIRPLVSARYPLSRGAEALHAIAQRKATGKLVIEP